MVKKDATQPQEAKPLTNDETISKPAAAADPALPEKEAPMTPEERKQIFMAFGVAIGFWLLFKVFGPSF
ncbi:hypothetical protein HDU98_006887 [Podochytrium sp. JEL0797]|nr:hypothetical protein HDU98_006887 [Podochytrium sp. JEL0797]